jgi:hypothetical protein
MYSLDENRLFFVRLVEHINAKNQDVKSRQVAGLIEKIPHLWATTIIFLCFNNYKFSSIIST